MLIRLWILKIIIDGALCELTGDNICEVEESYPVNVTEYSWRNATVRNYKWCMGFPPRCSFYTLKRVRVPNVVERNETRIVKKCCTGYAENSKHDGCVECKKCYYGTCGEDGECICNTGFKGEQCGEACESTRWGIDCQFQCLCEKGNCDPRTGRCDCPSGRFGTRCELLCLEGFYGKHCMHRCNCGERELCSSQTGECATRSTQRQEHQSTRAIHYLTEDILNFTRMIDKQKSTPSLKKYHTFDMEFNTNKPFHPKLTTVQITYVNEKWKPNSSNTTDSNIPKLKDTKTKTSKQLTTIKKKNYELNRKISKTKTNDDYIDSTTETSAEIERSIEHLPMLNENESLERKDSIESTKNIHEQQNKNDSSKIMNGVIQLATNESPSSVTSRNEENITKNTQSIGKKYQEKKNSQNQNQNWKKLGKTTVPYSEVNKIDSLEVKNQTGTKTEGKIIPRMELEENEKKHSASDNKSSVHKSVTNTYGPPIFINESSTKISSQPENNDQQKSSEAENTTIIPEDPGKYNFGLKGTATMSNNDVVINVSPTIESTSPLYSSKEQYREHGNRNEEEDKLQNLDTMLILTSRSTSTSVSIDQETTASKRNNILLFSAENPATKSTPTMNFIENSLYTTPSIEIRTPLEDIPDFRQKTEEDNYLSDEISGEFNYSSTDNGSLVTHVSIAVFTTLILVMIMTLMVLVHHYTRRRRKQSSKIRSEHHQNYSGGPTVSVYTHSIFHTPLPEPPTFENPVFASPTDNSLEHRTFQTHLVCSLNFPGHHPLEEKEYIYDHPPSTGSYRAASIPEPPDSNEAITAEPLYDEIPSNNKENNKTIQQPNKSSCIYVNTCGRTKF